MKFFLMVILALSLFSAVPASGEEGKGGSNLDYIFYKGNAMYEEGRYDEAVKEYEKIMDLGRESGSLYYNLGNSYLKKGEIGRAIVNYERAKRLIPGDSDLEMNFKFAVSQMEYTLPAKQAAWYMSAVNIFNEFSPGQVAVILSFLFTLVMIFFIVRLFYGPARRVSLYYLIIPALIFLIAGASFIFKLSSEDEGIIISDRSEAAFEPIDNATIHFTLYEGMKVFIVQYKTGWIRISRPDGQGGWIRADDIEKI